MYTLSVEQQQTLVDIINEEVGANLGFDQFAEAFLNLFEDIPGFETIPPIKANTIVNQLWSIYHGQEPR
jgi:hypothetical protein